MTGRPAGDMMYDILLLKDEINRVALQFHEIDGIEDGVFGYLSLSRPRFSSAEAGFLRVVSWLYVTYREAAGINIEFLKERLSAYGLDPDGDASAHYTNVYNLRTFLQHNLDPARSRNRQVQEACTIWFKEQCGTPAPAEESHWANCLQAMLREAGYFFEAVRECIRRIERDESRDQILREWSFRRSRYHPPQEFDRVISIVANDMGREHLDAPRFRKRFYDAWTKDLQTRQPDYDFDTEARKLIEHALLSETAPVLPITGHDIIAEFGIDPGVRVGELLASARNVYEASPCSSADLLERLRQDVQATSPPQSSSQPRNHRDSRA